MFFTQKRCTNLKSSLLLLKLSAQHYIDKYIYIQMYISIWNNYYLKY